MNPPQRGRSSIVTILAFITYVAIICATLYVLWNSLAYFRDVADTASLHYKMFLIAIVVCVAHSFSELLYWTVSRFVEIFK